MKEEVDRIRRIDASVTSPLPARAVLGVVLGAVLGATALTHGVAVRAADDKSISHTPERIALVRGLGLRHSFEAFEDGLHGARIGDSCLGDEEDEGAVVEPGGGIWELRRRAGIDGRRHDDHRDAAAGRAHSYELCDLGSARELCTASTAASKAASKGGSQATIHVRGERRKRGRATDAVREGCAMRERMQ